MQTAAEGASLLLENDLREHVLSNPKLLAKRLGL